MAAQNTFPKSSAAKQWIEGTRSNDGAKKVAL